MKHAANLINLKNYQDLIAVTKNANKCLMNGIETTSSQSTNPTNAIYVWEKFKSIFGSAFLASFGELPDSVWIESMARLSEKDINAGLNKVLRGGYDFAPSLSKFLKLCEPETVEDVYKNERESMLFIKQKLAIKHSDIKRGKCWELALQLEKQGIKGDLNEAEKLWSIH